MEKLNTQLLEIAFPQEPSGDRVIDNVSEIDYGLIDYIKYEHATGSDRAKKVLEQDYLEKQIVLFVNERGVSVEPARSLDIGCATCRYPQIFRDSGFKARGYDINEQVVEIYKRRFSNNKDIKIEVKNILESSPEDSQYDFITCMMGTFNHFSHNQIDGVLEWVYQSLNKNGRFVFSVWNQECYFSSFLSFYSRKTMDAIRANLVNLSDLMNKLEKSRFVEVSKKPICFLPSVCYESWNQELTESQILELDGFLSDNVEVYSNSQMIVFSIRK